MRPFNRSGREMNVIHIIIITQKNVYFGDSVQGYYVDTWKRTQHTHEHVL